MAGVKRIMTSLRRSRVFLGLAALALTVAGLAAAPSAAAESGSTPGKADKAQAGEQHCAVDVKTGATQCFGTFREAIEHATAGRVTDANLSAQTADSKTTAELNSGGSGVAALVIGVEYYWENFNRLPDGSLHQPAYTLTYSGDVACTTPLSNIDYRAAPLLNDAPPAGGTVNWNNNIRSFQGFNNCWQRMWDNANCTGLLLDYSPSSADLGAARDRTECIDWS
jgi:hypothetical protein